MIWLWLEELYPLLEMFKTLISKLWNCYFVISYKKRTASVPLKYERVNDLNLSWPAVSNILSLTIKLSTLHLLTAKSTEHVGLDFGIKVWSMYCRMKVVFPTSKIWN